MEIYQFEVDINCPRMYLAERKYPGGRGDFGYKYLHGANPHEIEVDDLPIRMDVAEIVDANKPMTHIIGKSVTWIISEELKSYIDAMDVGVHFFKKMETFVQGKYFCDVYWFFPGVSLEIPFDYEKTQWSGKVSGYEEAKLQKFTIDGEIFLQKEMPEGNSIFRGCEGVLRMAPYYCSEDFIKNMPLHLKHGLKFKHCTVLNSGGGQ